MYSLKRTSLILWFCVPGGVSQGEIISSYASCADSLKTIEKHLFMSCPISKEPKAVISFLEENSMFVKDENDLFLMKEGYSRFIATNASLNGLTLVDSVSTISISSTLNIEDEEILSNLTASYHFESETAFNTAHTDIRHFLENVLGLKSHCVTTHRQRWYLRYELPCNSTLILSKSFNSDQRYLRLSWNPKAAIPPPDICIDQLLASPDTFYIGNTKFNLSTHIWVDYMPTFPETSPRQFIIINVETTDGSTIPKSLTADAIWIVYNKQIWSSWLPKKGYHPPDAQSHILKKYLKGGPGWGTDILVDVIVRVSDDNRTEYFVHARDQFIRKTE